MAGLKSIATHNAERRAAYATLSQGTATGLACPHCMRELYEPMVSNTLSMFPPMKEVYCPSCNFKDTVLS